MPLEPVPDDAKNVRERGGLSAYRKHDLMTMGIAFAAIVLFVGTAGTVMPTIFQAWRGVANGPDVILANALLLNIALILLGWHRYKALNGQLDAHKASEREARRLADLDDLTGSLNRRSFAESLSRMMGQRAGSESAVAVIAIDLDNFKQVNDLNGHAAGDSVLKEVAHRVTSQLPEGAVLARLGGDEFVCALPYAPHAADRVELVATRIIEQVAKPVSHAGNSIDITVSVGMSNSKDLGGACVENPASDLMHKADIAMYHAKKQGKNRFYWFEAPMENELRFRNELEAGIRRGIERGEFVPYYEQQIDLDTGELVGFEMLARWNSPEMGLVGPDIFIPIAEEIGVIAEMSERLIEQAFADAKAWDSTISLSVNISPVQMRDPWFAQKILKLLVKHRFPAHRLEIEITETCLHENIGMVRSMITSLRNQGVKVSLDDFGTGYASLSQLKSLPFDRLKIDRSFISELKGEEQNIKLVEAIVSMSDGLKMPITAEGIEDEDILAALKKWGQMKGQGYHYGRPEPADKVLERLQIKGRLARISEDDIAEVVGEADNDTSRNKDSGSRAV